MSYCRRVRRYAGKFTLSDRNRFLKDTPANRALTGQRYVATASWQRSQYWSCSALPSGGLLRIRPQFSVTLRRCTSQPLDRIRGNSDHGESLPNSAAGDPICLKTESPLDRRAMQRNWQLAGANGRWPKCQSRTLPPRPARGGAKCSSRAIPAPRRRTVVAVKRVYEKPARGDG